MTELDTTSELRGLHVVIVPSTIALHANATTTPRGSQADTLRDLITIDERDISGRVLWRVRPWARFGRVNPGGDPATDEALTSAATGAAP